jgi:hypothetical protein
MLVTSYPIIDILRFLQSYNNTYFAPAETITVPKKSGKMKKFIFILIELLLLPSLGFCQSFVFCPDIHTKISQSFNNAEISFVLNDSREFQKKLKEKCTKDEIFGEFMNCIQRTYPKMQIQLLDEKKFLDPPEAGKVTIKIKFIRYECTYLPGVYRGITSYEVKIYDFRKKTDSATEQTCTGEAKESNMSGYTSGMRAANKSFKLAFDQFVQMLDTLALSFNSQNVNAKTGTQKNETKSKADRLRELKQLLDENILTQEEYEIEKKKILDEDQHP